MVLPKQPTHWLTIDPKDFHLVDFYLNNLVEDWWNPSEGEYPLINPHEAFIIKMQELGFEVFDLKKPR